MTTAQLRIKDLEGDLLEREIARAAKEAQHASLRLYVNDYWQSALAHSAYGVHLGQSDLESADCLKLASSGLRLGVSTHCHFEIARALSVSPSYIAVGPIYATTTKLMPFQPQGPAGFKYWRDLLSYPLVAIGGLFLDNASELISLGADGIAVVRDIGSASDPVERSQLWSALFDQSKGPDRSTPVTSVSMPG